MLHLVAKRGGGRDGEPWVRGAARRGAALDSSDRGRWLTMRVGVRSRVGVGVGVSQGQGPCA